MTDICSFPDCGRTVRTRGLCAAHYTQHIRHGQCKPLSTPGGQPKNRTCDAPDCDLPHYGLGYCERHYTAHRHGRPIVPLRARKTPEERGCDAPACDRPHKAGGYCRLHWERLHRGVPPDGPVRRRKSCEYPDCGRDHYARGLCKPHWRQRQAGKELQPVGVRTPRDPKPRKRVYKPRERKPASNLPDGWDKKAKPATTARPATNYRDDSILWDLMPDHEWNDLAERMRAKLTAWGDLDLAEALGVAA